MESRHESPDAHQINTASTCDGPDANHGFAAPRHYDTVGRAGRVENGGPNGNSPKAPLGLHPDTLDLHPTGRDVLLGEKCTRSSLRHNERERSDLRTARVRDRLERPTLRSGRDALNLPIRPFGFLRFTPERFHVLLNSLFKVLFNFPSRYLFAIGLVVIFSLRWSLPPT